MPDYPKRASKAVVKRNRRVARRLLSAFSEGNTAIVREFIDPNIKNRSPHPPDSIKEEDEIDVQKRSFEDIHYKEDVSVAEGDMVFIGWDGSGTNTGELFGRGPTGKEFQAYGGEVLRFNDLGKVIEHFDHFSKPRIEGLGGCDLLDPDLVQQLNEQGLL
jgi:C-1 hydroxylase